MIVYKFIGSLMLIGLFCYLLQYVFITLVDNIFLMLQANIIFQIVIFITCVIVLLILKWFIKVAYKFQLEQDKIEAIEIERIEKDKRDMMKKVSYVSSLFPPYKTLEDDMEDRKKDKI